MGDIGRDRDHLSHLNDSWRSAGRMRRGRGRPPSL